MALPRALAGAVAVQLKKKNPAIVRSDPGR
jgi:hypothetical protein